MSFYCCKFHKTSARQNTRAKTDSTKFNISTV